MSKTCKGPCLPHCYNAKLHHFILIVIIFLILVRILYNPILECSTILHDMF